MLIVKERLAGAFESDAADLHHVAIMRDLEGIVDVLADEEEMLPVSPMRITNAATASAR